MRELNFFVNTDFILNILSPRKASAQMQYLELVNMIGDDSNPAVDREAVELKYSFKKLSPKANLYRYRYP